MSCDTVDFRDEVERRHNAVQQQAATEWELPVDIFGVFEAPNCPVDLLPDGIGAFVTDQSELLGVDPGMLAGAVLGTLAGAIDDGFQVQPKRHETSWMESARLWIALVAGPSAKKSPVLKLATSSARTVDLTWSEEDAKATEDYRIEDQIHSKAEKAYTTKRAKGEDADRPNKPEKPRQRRAVIEDITVEAVSDVLRDNPRGILCVADELTGWFGAMDAYKAKGGASKDRPHWLTAFNGGPRRIDRVSRPSVLVPNFSVSIVGGIQPGPLRRIVAGFDDDGLLQRFLPIIARPHVPGVDRPPNVEASKAYRRLVERLYGATPNHIPFTLTEGAHKIREDLLRFLGDAMVYGTVSPALGAHLAKWEGIFPRLLCLWHVVEHAEEERRPPDDVSEDTAYRVAEFSKRFLLPHAFAFYSSVADTRQETDHARWVAGYILARGLGTISRRDLARAYRPFRVAPSREVAAVMDVLEGTVWVKAEDRDGPNPPTRWIVNPRVHTMFAERATRERQRREETKRKIAETVTFFRNDASKSTVDIVDDRHD